MSHSSTFNSESDTDRESDAPESGKGRWVPKAALLTLAMLVLINFLSGWLIAQTGWLPSEPRLLVQKQIQSLRECDQIWLLGSSTLAQGVDPEQLKEETGKQIAMLTLGSAGPVSLTEMAMVGLADSSAPPDAIYLFLFKDALNGNRPTIDNDRRYVDSLNSPSLMERVTSFIAIYNYRHSIKFNLRRSVVGIVTSDRGVEVDLEKIKVKPLEDADTVSLMDSGADYEVNLGRLEDLSKACEQSGVELFVVITPTADAAINWQAKYAPHLPYNQLIDQIKRRGALVGFQVLDYTDLFPSTTLYFRDPYHIREQHMAEFTHTFAEHLSSRMLD